MAGRTRGELQVEEQVERGSIVDALDEGGRQGALDGGPVGNVDTGEGGRRVEDFRRRDRDAGFAECMHEAQQRRQQERRVAVRRRSHHCDLT
jgi:hypothetical protein